VEDRREAGADQHLVVAHQHPDHACAAVVEGAGAPEGILARTANPPASVGPAASAPPTAVTRSRRPARPRPPPCCPTRLRGPPPDAVVTSTEISLSSCRTRTVVAAPGACFRALVRASCTTR